MIFTMKTVTAKLVRPFRVLFFLSIIYVLFHGNKTSPISYLDIIPICISVILFLAYMYMNFKRDREKFTIIMAPVSVLLAIMTVWIIVFGLH